jgi:two-component system cell cycle response regulator
MINILHVERGTFFRKVIKDIAAQSGLVHFESDSAETAFEILEKEEIDLIITGLELSDTSGEQFIERLRRTQFNGIPVMVISSNDSMEIYEKMFSLGVVDFIHKKDISYDRFNRYIQSIVKEDTLITKIRQMDIAVLDDSQVSLNVIKNIFSLNRITKVDYFKDPKDLLRSPKEYSIYILDLILPEVSGDEVIMKVREKSTNNVIISISSIKNYKTISNILLIGADDYIIKPFDSNIFMARLKGTVRTLTLLEEIKKLKSQLP